MIHPSVEFAGIYLRGQIVKMVNCTVILLLISSMAVTSVAKPAESKMISGLWLTVPDHNWAFVINTPGFELESNALGKNSRGKWSRRAMATNPSTGLIFSVFIEQEPKPKTKGVSALRDEEWPASRQLGPESQFKKIDQNNFAGVEYLIRVKDSSLEQRGMHFYWIKDDCWMEIHLSKINPKPGDDKLFFKLVENASIALGSNPEVLTKFVAAIKVFRKEAYHEAIPLYENILDMEKNNRSLDQTFWRVLVDELGMAYGITGNLNKSRATLEYGISQDPEYSMFYYNLACGYAEDGNFKKVISQLRLAHKNKAALDPRESLPDARTDDSFKRYWKDPKFLKALLKMEKK